jgi:mono/diheme cytochrome c family protein
MIRPLGLLLLASLAAAQQPPAGSGVGKRYGGPALEALLPGAKALVVVFTAADCPVSKLYKPKLDRLSKDWSPRGVRVAVVDAHDPAFGPLLAPARTTEAYLFDADGVLRYRGAVDDQYAVGVQRDAPRSTWLADAVDAVLAGKAPAVPYTEAPGCAVEARPGAAPAAAAPSSGKVTFHKDVAPVLQKRCADCHRPGEIGPFPLLTYADAKKVARRLKEAVVSRRMPPWHADAKHGSWTNDRSLSDAERAVLVAWADGGTPEGSPKDAPKPKVYLDGWTIGKPDAVFSLPSPVKVPAEGAIPYRYVPVPTNLAEDRWVQAIEVRPGARKVVHHILVFITYPLTRLKEQPKLDGGLEGGYFGIMVPGESPMVFPEGSGKKVPAGGTLLFQIHYTATGEAAEDRSSIGLVWAKKAPTREVTTRGIVNKRIRIPAGAADHREEAAWTLDHDARILGLLPHLHVRGKAFRYTALLPDGREQVLLDVPRYDFNWQTCYRPKDLVLKAGTRIRAEARYDNSAANPANPDPSKEVRFGEQTWEEMLIGYVDFVKE